MRNSAAGVRDLNNRAMGRVCGAGGGWTAHLRQGVPARVRKLQHCLGRGGMEIGPGSCAVGWLGSQGSGGREALICSSVAGLGVGGKLSARKPGRAAHCQPGTQRQGKALATRSQECMFYIRSCIQAS
jgi:hypothetical protein